MVRKPGPTRRMSCRRRTARHRLAFLFAALLAASTAAADPVDSSTPRRVLFIGNSLTFYNELPQIVARMARAAGLEHSLEVERITRGGETFARHIDRDDAGAPLRVIAGGRWDVVVLQENGRLAQGASGASLSDARTLVEAIRQSGARPLFYMTWAYRDRQSDWPNVVATYKGFAVHLDAEVAPVGPAWRLALRKAPEIDLYQADGVHPSPEGSYLAACVFFAQLFGKSPVGLPHDPGLGVSDEPTRRLQEIAWTMVRAFEQWREQG